jgi:hypothetical protein
MEKTQEVFEYSKEVVSEWFVNGRSSDDLIPESWNRI